MDPVKVQRPGYFLGMDVLLTDQVVTAMHRKPPTWWKLPRRRADIVNVAVDIRHIRGYVGITRLLMALGQRPDQDEDGEWYE